MGKLWALPAIGIAVGCGSPSTSPPPDASNGPPTASSASDAAPWIVTSVDERGGPRFLWSTAREPVGSQTPSDAAREHLARATAAFAITPEALATARAVRSIGQQSGVSVTTFRQE